MFIVSVHTSIVCLAKRLSLRMLACDIWMVPFNLLHVRGVTYSFTGATCYFCRGTTAVGVGASWSARPHDY